MAEIAEHDQHKVTVEIGCGSGRRARPVPAEIGVGVDVDINALRTAVRSTAGWTFIGADGLALPLRDNSCADLHIQAVLHHLVPTATALGELARVLQPSGVLTIRDGVALDANEAAHLDDELRQAGHPSEPVYGFDLDELAELVRASGLVIEDIHMEGTATWATPPFVSKPYTSERFHLTALHP